MSVTLMGVDLGVNMRLWKIAAALKMAGISYNFTPLNLGVDNETVEYMNNCHPMGRTPSLQTEDGYIFESNSILRYIARADKSNSFLYGRTTFEATQVDMWLDYQTNELDSVASCFFYKNCFGAPCTAEEEAKNVVKGQEALAGLERWLEVRTFLAGERITIADISMAFTLDILYRWSLDKQEDFTKKFKNVFRFYQTVINQPKVVEALQAHGAAIGLPKPEKPKKEEKPKAEKAPKKKEEKPAEDDDLLEEPMEEKKKPNPLDLLPPSKFVLDAFKREYSNKDTRKEAAPFLFDNYDAEGFSAFWCKYKYNEELDKSFMTSNLIRGWFQRMDHVRKYAFGSVLVIGEEGKHEIQGFWIFRGKGMPAIVTEVDDTEVYNWTEIPDIKAEKDKIVDFLCWDGETFKSAPVLEGRVYK